MPLGLGAAPGEHGWLEAALATLVGSAELEGCQNRVNVLRCEADLALAASKRARGEEQTTRSHRNRPDSLVDGISKLRPAGVTG